MFRCLYCTVVFCDLLCVRHLAKLHRSCCVIWRSVFFFSGAYYGMKSTLGPDSATTMIFSFFHPIDRDITRIVRYHSTMDSRCGMRLRQFYKYLKNKVSGLESMDGVSVHDQNLFTVPIHSGCEQEIYILYANFLLPTSSVSDPDLFFTDPDPGFFSQSGSGSGSR